MKDFIYLSPPHMSGDEMKYIQEAFDTNWIAPVGPHVDKFEEVFVRYHGIGYAAAVSTGTAALHLILRILNVGPGDDVFCSTFSFCASASPIVYVGARPVFIDSESKSWNMDPVLLGEEMRLASQENRLPKAVIVVHLYGQSADMDPILEICQEYQVPLIEDAAEALGAKYKKRPLGTIGTAGFFSFNGNKIITTSGGGMIISNDAIIIEKSRFLATQARDPAPHYQHSEIGYNYRMSNVLAGIGIAQMAVLDKRITKCREIFSKYQKMFYNVPGISFMPEPEWSRGNRWLTCILVDPEKFGADREQIRKVLLENDIESRPLWKPLHSQPVFSKYRACGGDVSLKLFKNGLCLPSGTAMKDTDLDRVCNIVLSLHKK